MFEFINKLFKPKADLFRLVQEGALIVDVRTKPEYNAGHIEGSKNIPLDALKKEIIALKNLNKPVITVCRSGNRSETAKSILNAAGIQAYDGGAWTNFKT
jgi:phage shock protein E